MGESLKNKLWNIFLVGFWNTIILKSGRSINTTDNFFDLLWHVFFEEPIDQMPSKYDEILALIRKRFFEWEWYGVLDFLEYISEAYSMFDRDKKVIIDTFNGVFEEENAGYRFVNGEITEITNPHEIEAIEKTFADTRKGKLSVVGDHLASALTKLSDRKNPDYRNSIKESISAVESLCKKITGKPKATLGEALKAIEKDGRVDLHAALKNGYEAIYGYTSDADGIRHAMTEQSNCDFADAKYMLVSCSAFINYLLEKSIKAEIKF